MTTLRYNPANQALTLSGHLGRLFNEDLFGPSRAPETASVPVDIHETDKSIMIYAEMPGVDKKHVSIDLKDGVLTISGTRQEDQEIKKEQYFKRERTAGYFKRSFTLTDRVNQNEIKASMENGVLTLEIPKTETAKPRQITID